MKKEPETEPCPESQSAIPTNEEHGRQRLLADTEISSPESLTSSDSEDAVFQADQFSSLLSSKSKLTRQNAIRKPRQTVIACPRNTCNLDEELDSAEDRMKVDDDPHEEELFDEDVVAKITPRRSARLQHHLDYSLMNESGERVFKDPRREGRR